MNDIVTEPRELTRKEQLEAELPKKITIFNQEFTLIVRDENSRNDENMGKIDIKTGKIFIAESLPSSIAKSTLLHEIIHAILDIGGYHKDSSRESLIAILEVGLMSTGLIRL